MPRKLKVVDIENASYDDVKDAVVESSAEEPPPTEVTVQPSVVEEEVPPVKEEVQDDGFVEVKGKKQAARATCEYCNREMTARNILTQPFALAGLRRVQLMTMKLQHLQC